MPSVKILIVEDENIIARDICVRLEHFGYAVAATVATGEESIVQARALRPDLVLMDIVLCGPMDGIEAARVIREEMNIPVIFITAFADRGTLALLCEAYTDDPGRPSGRAGCGDSAGSHQMRRHRKHDGFRRQRLACG